ncbi:hypothetical protein M409DRAFT_16314 [Zasmidium cellare ATCC 36951]|uniref:AB hydrolase-1 domain-containing protein n=1 Tax=Zasmidium cellare ATCC 36951 TaxID=1080233 RepID=A0A6A6D6I3_ZASCE|nr:uncharacterized protein M409DRAFT_16314 [Zasmidium cellare ATCC 36951]KAF2174038.1 hypothetical protein M409DRAFT_16314 [Zasmidium cellare ATCC 36951]
MAYIGTKPNATATNGPVALFIHGNPTSSYLWRNIIPHVSPLMRCVAPDLIGMGHSSKPANLQYRFTDHYTFLATFIETVIPSSPLLLVVYDWGSALGLHWAHQQAELSNPDSPPRVLGIALMEFIRLFRDWEDFSNREEVRATFQAYRNPEVGRKLIIEQKSFVEKTLPRGVVRKMTDAEMGVYRRPFLKPDDRLPTYVWPNQIPINHRPSDVYDIATRYHNWLLTTEVPKLFFWATPGTLVSVEKAQWYAKTLKNTRTIHLGKGGHFLTEDHPKKVGRNVHDWVVEVLLAKAI